MAEYRPQEIEEKWHKIWEKNAIYKTGQNQDGKKFYALDMFPYPSGSAMHVGHCKGYIASDVIARMKMMQGFDVLHPMGWDAFGLPAENFAIKNKIHPAKAVDENIKQFKSQLEKIGFTYDWSREINTTDPKYYKWTQWQFKKMFQQGLVKSISEPVNYCPSCKTVLANEDVDDGKCERCSSQVERKPIKEWEILITKYADRLLNDLDKLDWEESILEMQRNWIGRSEGAEIRFEVKTQNSKSINIFTTRLDTIFGCTYCVVAPEHEILNDLKDSIENWKEVEAYLQSSKQKTDLERTDLAKEKTGVCLKGLKAINPFNNKEVEIFVGDYVLGHYGTGAIMAVPAHDQRDFEFAKKHELEILEVISGGKDLPFTDDGTLINSGEFIGLRSAQARDKMLEFAITKGFGFKTINYKMRDWVFARQRYWGEPIPLIYCPHCAQKINSGDFNKNDFYDGEILNPGWIAIPDNDLPVVLPDVASYEPIGDGKSPLAGVESFVKTKCPKCGGDAQRETNTMPQWAGSCWYYLRYIDPQNDNALVDLEKEKHWSPVDLYIGGAEHATRHLLYARFWHKFLFDNKLVNYDEPFKKLQHVGLILGEDNQKMSKRWGNVVNPDDVIKNHGADVLRVYEMFMGPFWESCAWNTNGLLGAKRFLEKVCKIYDKISDKEDDLQTKQLLHRTIKKTSQDILEFKFNTAISQMMIFINYAEKQEAISKESFTDFIKILSPFAPHICEELFQNIEGKNIFVSIFKSKWPEADESLLEDKIVKIAVQINGKARGEIEYENGSTQEQIIEIARNNPNLKKWIDGKEFKKVVYVPGKILNIVL